MLSPSCPLIPPQFTPPVLFCSRQAAADINPMFEEAGYDVLEDQSALRSAKTIDLADTVALRMSSNSLFSMSGETSLLDLSDGVSGSGLQAGRRRKRRGGAQASRSVFST